MNCAERCSGINGLGLLKAVGQDLEKRRYPVHDVGGRFRVERNDPHSPDEDQLCDAGRHLADLPLPHPEEKNYMYFRGGTIRMGKLLMPDAYMQVVDTDPGDWFDFYLDRYNEQLVAGFSRNQPDYGLLVFMRDFSDLGSPIGLRTQ